MQDPPYLSRAVLLRSSFTPDRVSLMYVTQDTWRTMIGLLHEFYQADSAGVTQPPSARAVDAYNLAGELLALFDREGIDLRPGAEHRTK